MTDKIDERRGLTRDDIDFVRDAIRDVIIEEEDEREFENFIHTLRAAILVFIILLVAIAAYLAAEMLPSLCGV